ncbi:cystathionine beta-lyase [Streptococcus constellatus]|uniref:cystathionine beta-lyase n=1 Tax=Streptococcus constellatus TaxID=76860 RepID=UPI0021031BA4|nr:cystathionine beta-lyase [Streptococcus constellatus]UTX63959.1 cystathionine beta-lyase [Streptococcus constellatus]
MTDYINLALKYGGFTSLDRIYLEKVLDKLSNSQKLTFITPPPSVINAYFSELYQKKSPEAATDYFLALSKELLLFNSSPNFEEEKPFIRLNLSGKSYGFCFENEDGTGLIFPEIPEVIEPDLLFEIAQLFPHYLVYEDGKVIRMIPAAPEEIVQKQALSALTDCYELADGRIKLEGYNQEELSQLAQTYSGQLYYRSQNRSAMIYIKKK